MLNTYIRKLSGSLFHFLTFSILSPEAIKPETEMASIESDVKSAVGTVLDRLQTQCHVTETGKQTMERWVVETVEKERRGWKGRLREAARAADAEHRHTLAAHTAIRQIVADIVNRLPPNSASAVADQLFKDGVQADDDDDAGGGGEQTDRKADRLVQLEKYWAAMERLAKPGRKLADNYG